MNDDSVHTLLREKSGPDALAAPGTLRALKVWTTPKVITSAAADDTENHVNANNDGTTLHS